MSRTGSPWVKMVRRWVALYTRGLPVDVRDRRLLELESDVWEHLSDADEPNARRAVFGRFLRGAPADVWWRYHMLLESRGARQRSQKMTTSLPDQHQNNMTRLWFVWIAGAAVLFAIGWIPLIVEGGDLTWGYFIWVLSWLAAIVTAGTGVILAALRLTLRHHTRRTDGPPSQSA